MSNYHLFCHVEFRKQILKGNAVLHSLFCIILNGESILIYTMKTILIGFPSGYVDKALNFCNEFDLFGLSILSCDYNFKVYVKPIKAIPISQFGKFIDSILVYCSHFFKHHLKLDLQS